MSPCTRHRCQKVTPERPTDHIVIHRRVRQLAVVTQYPVLKQEIMVGHNTNKKSFFPLEKRIKWIREVFEFDNNISVEVHDGLTVDFCKKVGAQYILRGLRTSADFEFERAIAQVNKQMYPEIETVFLLTIPEHTPVNSTIVRDIIMHGGDASRFLPRTLNMNEFRNGNGKPEEQG